MRSAARGDVGGADALMRTLGLVREAAADFQGYAGGKFRKDEDANAARGAVDQAGGDIDPELERKSAAYKDSVARGRTASAWNDYALEMDTELHGIVENQQQLTLEERREELSQFLETKFRDFAVNAESGELQDFLATPGAMRWLGEKMGEARGMVQAKATGIIEARFNNEALGHFTKNLRDQAKSGPVDFPAALALIPPTVPDNIKKDAIKDTVMEIVDQLKTSGREVEGRQLLDSLLDGGFAAGVGGSTDQTAIDAVRGGPVEVDIPASSAAPVATLAAPTYSRAALKAKIRGPESGGDDNATNGMGSSASGRYQFVEGTFKQLYKRVYSASSSAARDAWTTKRFDAAVQEKLMDALVKDNEATLTAARIPINDANMYVMHVLGSGDGPTFLKASPGTPVADILSAAIVRQNPTYFGGGKTVGQAHTRIASVVGASAEGGAGDPVEGDPTYQSPGRDQSPLEQYLRGPKAPPATPVMTGGLAWTQQERNGILELRRRYTDAAIEEWHKKRGEAQSSSAHGMMMRVFGQGAAVTSQDITEAAERGDIAEPDAITLFRMLRDDAARERAEADRADSQADRQRERAEANVVDSLTADIMAPVYTGKRTPEQARALMLSRLRQVPSAIARRAIAEMTPALNALESASEQTPQARDTLEHMDDQDRRVFMGSALQGIGAIRRKQVVAEAGNLMDQAIQRTQRDISRGVLPVDARERAYQWLKMELGALRLRHRRPLPAGTPGGKSYGFGDFLTNVWGDLTS